MGRGASETMEAMCEFIIAMASMDTRLAESISAIKQEWCNIKTADTEAALREELQLYTKATRIAKKIGGHGVLCTHEVYTVVPKQSHPAA